MYLAGVDGMGLIWSIHSGGGRGNGMRLVKKDVTSPMVYNLKLFNGVIEDTASVEGQHITETTVDRCYMRDGVRRIPVKDGKLRGTIFIPEGNLTQTAQSILGQVPVSLKLL
ncbi:MAG: acyl-CoA thioesterase/BAAT N-terminal domain-containing protein [Sedimenticola sp.]